MPDWARKLVGGAATLISLFSFLCTVRACEDLVKGKEPGTALGLVVFFGGVAIGSAVISYLNLRKPAALPDPSRPVVSAFEAEQRILALAQRTDAQLTLAEVALECHLSIEDGKEALDKLIAESVVMTDLTREGQLVYNFFGITPDHPIIEAEIVPHEAIPAQLPAPQRLSAPPSLPAARREREEN